MRHIVLFLTGATVWMTGVEPAAAQWGGRYWGRGGYHASTAAEGYQRGMADVIRSQGKKNLMDAQAANVAEDARSKYIDNRLKATEAYYERKQIRKDALAADRDQRRSSLAAYVHKTSVAELTDKDVDPATGEIAWPEMLRDSQFDDYRTRMDQLFTARAKYGALTSEEYIEALGISKDWRKELTALRGKGLSLDVLRPPIRFILGLDKMLTQK